MADKVQTTEIKTPAPAPAAEGAAPAAGAPAPRRGPGHRGADVRDTVAEMTEKAQQLSLEAGSKVAGAMKDVIYAAAGITGFAIESARDLVQYMVRRGQMRSEEAERIMREVEDAHAKRKPGSPAPAPRAAEPPRMVAPTPAPQYVPPKPHSPMPTSAPIPSRPTGKSAAPAKTPAKASQSAKPAAKSAPAKGKVAARAKTPPKAAAKSGGAKKAAKKR
ncbi:MAG TPA: hypothetical protein VHM30_08335 [Gemmatimonadaceae bacterium]|nr:hypothetical protein [Gemmatimonadaceae bacterium]